MRKFLPLILIAFALSAQTTNYPGSLDTASTLFNTADNVQTTLSSAMAAGDNVAVVVSSTGFAANMIATICDSSSSTGKCTAWEHMLITNVSGNVLTVTRGFAVTSAVSHAAGKLVSVLIDSAHQKVLKDAIIALQTALGPNLGNIPTSPLVSSKAFNFTAITSGSGVTSPGGTLAAGNNALTFLTVPPGANGTDTKHYLYISAGTGTAEACLITGGTGVAGGTNGQIIVNCANSHSGAWTVQSATAGITEAETSLKASTSASGGGMVTIPAGSYTIYAAIPWRQNIQFAGAGAGTILVPASSTSIVFDSDVPVKTADEHTLVDDNAAFRDFLIDASSFTGVNSVYGIRGLNQNASTELYSFSGILIRNVLFNNVHFGVYLDRSHWVRADHCQLYENSTFTFTDSTMNTSYHSANISIDHLFYTWHPINGANQVASMTDSVLSFINCEIVYLVNSQMNGPGGANAFGVTFSGTGEDFTCANTVMVNWYAAFIFSTQTISATAYYPGFLRVMSCSFDQIWGPLFALTNGTATTDGNQVAHVLLSGNYFTDLIVSQGATANFFNTGLYTKHVQFTGNTFRNVYGSTTQTAVIIGNSADDIRFDSTNIFLNETGDVPGSTAIFVSTTALGVYGLDGLIFTNFAININDGSSTVASAGTVTLPKGRTVVTISGTTGITAVTAATAGTRVLLLFTGNLTVTDGSNLKLAGNFVSGAGGASMLSLYSDGTNWIEISRAVN